MLSRTLILSLVMAVGGVSPALASPLARVSEHGGRISGIPSMGFHALQAEETLDNLTPLRSTQFHSVPVPITQIYRPKQVQLSKVSRQAYIKVLKSTQTLQLIDKGQVLAEFPVSTGKYLYDTPLGSFRIISKVPNPPYYGKHMGRRYFPPRHPNNPLGTQWMQINKGHYQTGVALGIHGTDSPEQLGKPVSGGCIRMHNKDVNALASVIPKGIKVVIAD